ncbi:MAG: phosphoribosylamine--glycine ligase [Candidatus Saccharibacteria bacterium]|nr:phosphoribosylamine--glycine ligase [Candidatus Saccharibacteria bacterium]
MSERILTVGNMARDDIIAEHLGGAVLNVMAGHLHPGLVEKVNKTGGLFYQTTNMKNGEVAAAFAQDVDATLAIVTGDNQLAARVVDALQVANPGLLIAAPNRASFKPEADKLETRLINEKISKQLNHDFNPFYIVANNPAEVEEAAAEFERRGWSMVVKPRAPADGRGVQVMGKQGHFQTYSAGAKYAKDVLKLPGQPGVLFEEELLGPEFNLQGWTDGLNLLAPPVTVDYPYRLDGDQGPGTGGMGSFNFAPGELPGFLKPEDYQLAMLYTRCFLQEMRDRGLDFKGVIYPNFKLTKDGIKSIENNLRPGDPEWMNIVTSLEARLDHVEQYKRIATGQFQPEKIGWTGLASTVIYGVAPTYAFETRKFKPHYFILNPDILTYFGVKAYFSAAERVTENMFATVSQSRAVALVAAGDKPWEARARILEAIMARGMTGELEYRLQIGEEAYIESLQDPRAA